MPKDITYNSSKNYRPEIDGLRAIAVISVIIYHFNKELLPHGFLGVDMFFVISGYVITSSLANREYENLGDFLVAFYARRIKRLMPALIACIAITCLIGFLFIPPVSEDFVSTWQTAIAALFGLSNLYLFKQSTNYFGASTELNLFTQTWSLGVEEQFYLIFPFILWFTGFSKSHFGGKKKLFFLMILLSTVSLCSYLWLGKVNQSASYFLMSSRFWELGLGCITFLALQSARSRPNILKFATPLLIVLLLIAVLYIPEIAGKISTIAAVALTSLLIGTLNSNSSVYKALTWRPVLLIGLISYSLYLWHWSILAISRWTIGIHLLTLPFQLGLLILFASVSYKYIEQPFRYSKWSRVKTIGYGLGTSSFCTFLILVLSYSSFKNLFYIGKEAGLIKKGAFSITEKNHWNGRVAWSGEKCINEVGKIIKPESCTFGLLRNKGNHFLVIGNSFSVAEIEMYKVLVNKGLGSVTVTSSMNASPIQEIPPYQGFLSEAHNYYWSSVVPNLVSDLKKGDIVIMIFDIANFAPSSQNQQSVENLKTFQDGLSKFTRQLNKKGIGVIFQSVDPFLRESNCLPDVTLTDISMKKLLPFQGIGACNFYTKIDSLKRREPLHNVLINLEKTNQNFKVLDLFHILCPDRECSYIAYGNKFMYRDIYSHLSVEASIMSQPQLLSAVEALKVKMRSK